jgi:SAM-dependent methyltransferase
MIIQSLKPDAAALATCPICGQPAGDPVWAAPEHGREAFTCAACDFTYIWPRSPQDFSNVPTEFYHGGARQLDYSAGDFYVADIGNSEGRSLKQRALASEAPAILDVGCGAGEVMMQFRKHGWTVRGVDPWASVAEIGRTSLNLPIETARIEEATSVPPASQDVVISIDVLQFAADPLAFLAACMTALRPGGLLYLTLPNFAATDGAHLGWTFPRFLPHSYLSYFSPTSVRRLAEKAGLTRIRVKVSGGAADDDILRVTARRPIENRLSWSDLGSVIDDNDLPPLDRANVDVSTLSPEQHAWREHGYLILPGLIPDELIERYTAIRGQVSHRQGWTSSTPYMDVPEIRDLCLYKPLTDMIEHLLGEPVALHLNLTGWVSTERDWHQDDYLNPPQVNGHYAGVWTALDQIQPDAGPFEYVPGSHRWPVIRQAKVLEQLGYENGDDPSWPWASERLLTPFFEQEIVRTGLKPERFLGARGDVLIWHSRLVHRGSLPARPNAERRSMIAHYSAISRRADMRRTRQHPGGGQYFYLDGKPDDAPPKPKRFRWL